MLNETSIAGIRTLIYLALRASDEPVSPRRIAAELELSPTYLAKVAGSLVKADILRSRRGSKGGVNLRRAPADITLLQIVEAFQGKLLANYCEETGMMRRVCAFHRAMSELHGAIGGILSSWTLADLAAKAEPSPSLAKTVDCRTSVRRAGGSSR